jgi:hypothetical protein
MKKFIQFLNENTQMMSEMPYVNISKDDPDALFDFEFEKYETPSDFFARLEQLFDGQEHEDKYGNTIGPIISASDRQSIIDAILQDELGMVFAVANNKWRLKAKEFKLLLQQFLDEFN